MNPVEKNSSFCFKNKDGISMNNFTTNKYEMKKEILNFSKKVSVVTNKVTTKFIMDMQYGLSKS